MEEHTAMLHDLHIGGHGEQTVRATVEESALGVGISFDVDGLGGDGTPVYVENRGGIPHVVVWADPSNCNPTHVIRLVPEKEEESR